jgi:hypothetical protein
VNLVKRLCLNANRKRFVVDTYGNGSVKDSSRIRRCEKTAIEGNNLKDDTALPVKFNAVWAWWCSRATKGHIYRALRKLIYSSALP